MQKQYEKFKAILREMFQMDQADLDFGIYRIMNAKRAEIEKYLDEDLKPQVYSEFEKYRGAGIEEKKKKLDEMKKYLKEAGADPDTAPKVLELNEEIARYGDDEALANDVFSHLASFFRRYYDNGDFISLRRYKKDTYAIPYEGEEVKLHWANADQYYIKTTEYLKDYTFKLPGGQRVHFKLIDATQEKDNNKTDTGKERKFMLSEDEPVKIENDELFIRFVYLADKEKQDKHNAAAIEKLSGDMSRKLKGFQGLFAKAPTEKNEGRTILEKHLNSYTARFNFDFFIHKDLGGFLRRELDFYLKNEVIYIDDLDAQDEQKLKSEVAKAKVIKHIGKKIITFLAQLEEFQKKLWLKKKFVIDCGYCITLDRVPEELYPEIVKNKEQVDEWIKLYAINEIKGDLTTPGFSKKMGVEFLKANKYLLLDTRFFNTTFIEEMFNSINDVDYNCCGHLLNSDNFHGLSLINEKHSNNLKAIHIDPPYNTKTSGFLYKNDYQHSSWLAMMENRIKIGISLLAEDGSYICHIDENEYERLFLLFDNFNIPNAGTIAWDKRNPMNSDFGIATQHEYIVWRTKRDSPLLLRNTAIQEVLAMAEKIHLKYQAVNEQAQKEFSTWIDNNEKLTGGEKAYRYLDEKFRPYQSVSLRAPEPRTNSKFHEPLKHPKTKKPCPVPPNGFSRTPETLNEMISNGEILFGEDDTTQPRQKVLLTSETRRQISSVIQDARKGKADIDPMGFDFPYCHPISLYEEILFPVTELKNEIVCDFFAGSGTTGHAIVNLNRNDKGQRKFILMEMGDQFNNVLKPRIMKVVYSKDWKDGKPVSREGISHMFKYMRLESYDDMLDNLVPVRTESQQKALDLAHKDAQEEYKLKYMLDFETKGSLLNVDKFSDPFNYTINIRKDDELKPCKVDLVETFNYLIGLWVDKIDTIKGFKVITGKLRTGEKTLVIWRNTNEKSNKDLDDFFLKQKYNTLDMEFDLIYVNGDNNLENLRVDENKWKVKLIEEEFMKKMFESEAV